MQSTDTSGCVRAAFRVRRWTELHDTPETGHHAANDRPQAVARAAATVLHARRALPHGRLMPSSPDTPRTPNPLQFSDRLAARLAWLLAAATFVVGLTWATTAASGADAYGYVSQADLWLERRLTIDQTWLAAAEWPMARWTLAPLGYRPSNLVEQAWHLVPMYSPGLPLLMAAAKAIGGQELLFWIVPLSGAGLVLATFGIGRRLASPGAGLAAAWLVATSPAVLFMLMAPMSDVPVAAAWAASFYFLLNRGRKAAVAAGLAAGLAILIRPNLVFVAALFGLWYLVRIVKAHSDARRAEFVDGALFSIGVAAGATVVALVNRALNGSPLISGYGSLAGAFSSEFFWQNLTRYPRWLVETQSPIVLLGIAALAVPARALWPAARDRTPILLMLPSAVAIWLFYLFYRVYEEWWFLRFVLTSWPFFMVGLGAVLALAARRGGRLTTALLVTGVVALGAWQVTVAIDRSAFNLWKEERRYVTVGRAVRRITDRQSVVFAMQHSGSVRYYGGRMTLRYDGFTGAWIDRVVRWLGDRGITSYMLLDDWEVPIAREQFSQLETGRRLLEPPLLRYRGTSEVFLWKIGGPGEPLTDGESIYDDYVGTRSVEPVAFVPPTLLPYDGPPGFPDLTPPE